MVKDTTSEAPAQAPATPGAQGREHADPTERSQPIPLLAASVMVAVLLFGAGYIALAEPPGAPAVGDRRSLADLRSTGADGKQAGAADGAQLYAAKCVACHQTTGKGLAGVFPPLDGSEWVLGQERVLANLLLHGIEGEIVVAGVTYKGAMPPFKQLTDAELAALASHVRQQWSNKAKPVTAALIAQERKANPRTTPFAGGAELTALGARAP
jgi:mono/diheme cytochrome c family protein